jgi:integrase
MAAHKTHYLKTINGTYYVRTRLPKHMNFDKSEICFSLGINDIGRATLAVNIFKSLLARPKFANTNWLRVETLRLFEAIERQIETSLHEGMIPSLVSAAYPDDLLSMALERKPKNTIKLKEEVESTLPKLLSDNGVSFNIQAKEYELLKQKVIGIEYALSKYAISRQQGDFESQMAFQEKLENISNQKIGVPPADFKSIELPKLTLMIDTFIEQARNPKNNTKFSEDREKKFNEIFNEVLFFIGNKPVNFYTTQDIQDLFDYLAITPKARKKRYSKLSINELIELKVPLEQTVAYASKVKSRQKLRQFFSWVIEQAQISSDKLTKSLVLENPCDNIKIYKDRRQSKRTHFSKLDEKELFKRQLYLKKSVEDGLPIIREDHHYWGGLIMRTTGVRPNELFQSQLCNWDYDSSINTWILWATDKGENQTIKTEGSIRPIVMPQIIMDKGFDAFIKNQKVNYSKSTRLFHKIKATSSYYSPAFTTWFNNTLMKATNIAKEDQVGRKKSAYSLRHTFITSARKDGAQFDVIKQNVGHSIKRTLDTTADYMGEYDVDELYEHLKLLKFPALDEVPTYQEWLNNIRGFI